ncbi:MAG: pirin family protein, partial [Comamonadaceae bacterium]
MTAPQLLTPADKDLGGGFKVRRLLPSARRRSVGPFVFFDHFGPATERPGSEHDVRPHPHIGLATVTYLFEGAMMHRDSLGTVQEIRPGAINWMTSGRGIVHSERKPEQLKGETYTNHGLQLWAALPVA